MPRLRYQDASGKMIDLDLSGKEVVIGREAGCDLIVARRFVSRRHARCFPQGAGWAIADLGSSHGTFVNKVRVQQHALTGGDEIAIGDGGEVITFFDHPGLSATVDESLPHREPHEEKPESTSPGFRPEILAEQAFGEGELVKTMRGARGLDVASLTVRAQQSVAQLIAPGPDARVTPSAPTPNADSMRMDAAVAGHLLTLVRISDGLRRARDITAVCRTAVEMAIAATGASRGVLALRDGDGEDGFERVVQRDVVSPEATPADSIRISKTFVDGMVAKRVAVLACDTGLDMSLAHAESIAASGIRSILCTPLWDGDEILGYLYLDTTFGSKRFRREDLDFASAVGHQAAAEIALRREETRRTHLSRFLSADVVRHIEQRARAGNDPTTTATELDVTILFADIQGFTSMSEKMDPGYVKRLLDGYLDRMTEIIIDRYGGTLDKYIGDAIMALFGAPFGKGQEEDARRAVAAAVDMRDTIARMRAEDPAYAGLQVRIGVNTGRVIAGMLGSQRRLEYTVIGDAVNVASRLESTGEAGRIQIGEATYDAVKGAFLCESAGERPVKNRAAPVKSWWVTGRQAT